MSQGSVKHYFTLICDLLHTPKTFAAFGWGRRRLEGRRNTSKAEFPFKLFSYSFVICRKHVEMEIAAIKSDFIKTISSCNDFVLSLRINLKTFFYPAERRIRHRRDCATPHEACNLYAWQPKLNRDIDFSSPQLTRLPNSRAFEPFVQPQHLLLGCEELLDGNPTMPRRNHTSI